MFKDKPHPPEGPAGVWVICPYKDIVKAKGLHTNPAHMSVRVCATVAVTEGGVVPAGQLKNSAEYGIATARESKNTWPMVQL